MGRRHHDCGRWRSVRQAYWRLALPALADAPPHILARCLCPCSIDQTRMCSGSGRRRALARGWRVDRLEHDRGTARGCGAHQPARQGKPPIRLAGPDRQRPQIHDVCAPFFIHAPSCRPPPENVCVHCLISTGRLSQAVSHANSHDDGDRHATPLATGRKSTPISDLQRDHRADRITGSTAPTVFWAQTPSARSDRSRSRRCVRHLIGPTFNVGSRSTIWGLCSITLRPSTLIAALQDWITSLSRMV
jgi:hypothetical protein